MDITNLYCIEAQHHGTDPEGWSYSRQVPRFYVFAETEPDARGEALRLLTNVSDGAGDFALVVVARWVDMLPAPLSQH